MKTAITAGIFAALVMPSATALAAEEVKTSGHSEALRLMEQTREYVQQENRYRYYAAAETSQQQTQDKTRSMTGADNETGQGDLVRDRDQLRDGTGTGDQNKYGQPGSGQGPGGGSGGGRR